MAAQKKEFTVKSMVLLNESDEINFPFFDIEHLRSCATEKSRFKVLPSNLFLKLPKLSNLELQVDLECITENSFTNYDKLKIVDLSRNKLTLLKSQVFKNCKILTKLDVMNNLIKEAEAETFIGLKHLEELILSNNRLSYLSLKTFTRLNSLTSLNLRNNNFTEFRSF